MWPARLRAFSRTLMAATCTEEPTVMVCRGPKPPKPRVEVAESQRSAASSQPGKFATRLLAVDYDIIKHDLHRFPRNSQYRSQQHPNTLRWACRLAAFAGSFATHNMLGEANKNYKKYYRYFSQPTPFCISVGTCENHWQAAGVLAEQQLGEVLSGRSPPQARLNEGRVLSWGTAFAPDQPVSSIHFDVGKPSLDGVSAKSRLSLQRLKLERPHVSLDRVFRWASLSGRVAL